MGVTTTTRALLHSPSFHWKMWHRHVITLFIYDSRRKKKPENNKSPIHSSIRNAALSVCALTGSGPSIVQWEFTLKPIWCHCTLQRFIVYWALISTSSDTSQLPVTVNPPTALKGQTWVSATTHNNTTVSQLRPLCLVPGIPQRVYWALWRLFTVTNTWNTTIAAFPDAAMIGWAVTRALV